MTQPPQFDLDSITLAGVGRLEMSPAEWNQLDKSDPEPQRFESQPWFIPNRTQQFTDAELAEGWAGPKADLREVYGSLLTPSVLEAFLRDTPVDTRTLSERADRLGRRYSTGGTPPTPCARFGCKVIPKKTGKGRRVFCSAACKADAAQLTVSYRFPTHRAFPVLKVAEIEPEVWVCGPAA